MLSDNPTSSVLIVCVLVAVAPAAAGAVMAIVFSVTTFSVKLMLALSPSCTVKLGSVSTLPVPLLIDEVMAAKIEVGRLRGNALLRVNPKVFPAVVIPGLPPVKPIFPETV